MQRILQINIAGRIVPIEEDGYLMLKEYLASLERQFAAEDSQGIIEDIEHRIAELFAIRLQTGSPAIDRWDVKKVIDTLGTPDALRDEPIKASSTEYKYAGHNSTGYQKAQNRPYNRERLLRDPYDKMIGGVCSGLSHYFGIDPVIVRIIMVILFLTMGIGLVAYIIAWAIIPAARSREELAYNGQPMTIHDISRNMEAELQDLKHRGEQMSRELKDFFGKKK